MKDNIFAAVGRTFLDAVGFMGSVAIFLFEGLVQIFASVKIFPRSLRQIYVIGHKSLFLILLISLFCGDAKKIKVSSWIIAGLFVAMLLLTH